MKREDILDVVVGFLDGQEELVDKALFDKGEFTFDPAVITPRHILLADERDRMSAHFEYVRCRVTIDTLLQCVAFAMEEGVVGSVTLRSTPLLEGELHPD